MLEKFIYEGMIDPLVDEQIQAYYENPIIKNKVMRTCPSCGGIVGRDCFNPVECAAISESLATKHDQNHWQKGYDQGYQEGYHAALNEVQQRELNHEKQIDDLPF